jgi:glycerophosphoryl diester phosphodiesterase
MKLKMKAIKIFSIIGVWVMTISLTGYSSDNRNKQSLAGEPGKEAKDILLVCHRGANRLAPENTYASAKKAIEFNASYVEVDVRRSKDGVYYNLHDWSLDRTTNGTGPISETGSKVIDTLDAGAWFGHEYSGEKVPRLYEYLKWIKGKAKVYFDMKDVRLEEFIPVVYELGMENDCFFWFSSNQVAKEFRRLYPDLALKINASSVEDLDSIKEIYNPQIIECALEDLSEEFINSCRTKELKIMPLITGNDWEGYRIALQKNIDMVNLDNPDVFSNMVSNGGVFDGYKLIAHRGGIVEGIYDEFNPASIEAAIDQGYFMLEIDVRETKDGIFIVHHDPDFERFFNDPRRVDECSWEEVKLIKSAKGNYHPLLFEEVCKMCTGKVKMMIDVKVSNKSPDFYRKLGEIMEKYNLLEGAYFIDYESRNYFWGKARFLFRAAEANGIIEKYRNGEDVSCHYFLFDDGAKMTSSLIKMCQSAHITVVPSVNFGHYRIENPMRGAKRDIEFLKECGVTQFQIDSDFDDWLPH